MDFFKNRNRNSTNQLLNEKEYKCASLQAITNATVKENNEKRLKELVEEINSHLVELRTIQIENDVRSEEKRQHLIEVFEGCLVKLIKPNMHDDIFIKLNSLLEDIRKQCNNAIQERNVAELRKLSGKTEMNLQILKSLPEPNNKTFSEDLANLAIRYEELHNTIKSHFNSERISGPILTDVFHKKNEDQQKYFKAKEHIGNQILKNEMDEKFKIIQKKRINQPFSSNNVVTQLKTSDFTRSLTHVSERNELSAKWFEDTIDDCQNNTQIMDESTSQRNDLFETPSTAIKQSNSFKSDIRTPGQIRKMFNSCISPSSHSKSTEDLTEKFNIQIEHGQKIDKSKSSAFSERLKEFKMKDNVVGKSPQYENVKIVKEMKPPPNRELKSLVKRPQQISPYENVEFVHSVTKPLIPPRRNLINVVDPYISKEMRKFDRNSDPVRTSIIPKETITERISINEKDSKISPEKPLPIQLMLFHNNPDVRGELSDCHGQNNYIMTLKQDQPPSPNSTSDKCSFSTFRSSTELTQNIPSNIPVEEKTNINKNNTSKHYRATLRSKRSTLINDDMLVVTEMVDNITKIEQSIKQFKGLKYDSDYLKLDKKLAKYFVEIDNIKFSCDKVNAKKELLLSRLITAGEDLKSRITKNELLLRDVLEQQVELIAAQHGIKG